MMFRKIEDFLESYEHLTGGTTKIFEKLMDDNLNQSVKEGYRTLGQLAWHIVITIPEMMGRTGLTVSTIREDTPPPKTASEIIKGYAQVTRELSKAIKTNWTDATLLETDDMYGEQWQKGKTLLSLILHENHHVGQITVLLRQAGAKVPGLYGPSKEEWAQFGMEGPPY